MNRERIIRRWLIQALTIAALLAGVVALPAAASAQTGDFTIALSPTSGPPGTTVTISGSGAAPNAPVLILWVPWMPNQPCAPVGEEGSAVAQVTADAAGHFSATHLTEQMTERDIPSQGVLYVAKTGPGNGTASNISCFTFTPPYTFRYFPEIQHVVGRGFLAFWNQFGGLPVFGYPLTDEFQQNGVTVQYFERARFEWHPGSDPARYDVELGLLGDELTANRGREEPFQPAQPIADCRYFPETQHDLCAGFAAYWQQFGGLSLFGYPISQEFQENGVTVQYFERVRFEWHPGSDPARYDVELGRLGAEVLAAQQH